MFILMLCSCHYLRWWINVERQRRFPAFYVSNISRWRQGRIALFGVGACYCRDLHADGTNSVGFVASCMYLCSWYSDCANDFCKFYRWRLRFRYWTQWTSHIISQPFVESECNLPTPVINIDTKAEWTCFECFKIENKSRRFCLNVEPQNWRERVRC